MIPRFIQLHSLQSYPGALLNRDDAGLAKRLPFGGATRTRISSQCLKRHWRTAKDNYDLGTLNVPMAERSRRIISRRIHEPLIQAGVTEEVADAIGEAFLKALFQESKKGTPKSAEEKEEAAARSSFDTKQAVMFGQPEIDWLYEQAKRIADAADGDAKTAQTEADGFFKGKNTRENILSLKHNAGLESALFGRMVTSDLIANMDASIYVAHAFTVHDEESESDYFTVVDDLKDRSQDDPGAAGIFDMELTSGLYYGYVVINVPQLISNLEGCDPAEWSAAGIKRHIAGDVIHNFIHLMATVSPGAKLGSTAPFSWAQFLLIEAGERQPRSLANSFRTPVRKGAGIKGALDSIGDYLQKIDSAYGVEERRRFMCLEDTELPDAERYSLKELADWAKNIVINAQV